MRKTATTTTTAYGRSPRRARMGPLPVPSKGRVGEPGEPGREPGRQLPLLLLLPPPPEVGMA